MSSSNNNNENPSLIGGHAQFVKGAAENIIGSVTGSAAWSSSGATDKEAGIETMKAASANRDTSQGYGKAEELAGRVTGCEGMEEEGKASKKE